MKRYLNKEYLLTNKDKIIKATAVVVLVVIAFFSFVLGVGPEQDDMIIENNNTETATEPVKPELIMVDVSGAVNEPKVVHLPMDSRVTDAIEAAGGLTDKADTAQINQAAFLTDGEKIYVPEIGEDPSEAALNYGSPVSSGKVDINTATSEELQTLNGVGPATAEKILQYRNDVGYFKSIEEIKNVSGIGDKTYENLKEYIKV